MARVLCVDDDILVRSALGRYMVRDGHEVHEADDGLDALQILETAPIDVVVTDIIMPGMEGIELIKRIRASRPELPIMAISGGGRTGAEEYLGLAEEFGAQVRLAKPFDPDEMLAHIRRLAGETPHTG